MRYRTKVTVITDGREYESGEVLPSDISGVDLAFLKSKGFVEPADMASDTANSHDEEEQEEESSGFSGFDEREPDALKSPEEIRKLRSKKDVFSYAASIGLDLGEDYEGKSLKDLQEEVVNFQEEHLEGDDEFPEKE